MLRIFLVVAVIVPLAAAPAAAQALHSHDASLGSVRFTNSCAAAVQEDLTHAVVLLHSFEFGPSRDAFTKVAGADPSCAIALWGTALTQWGNPFATGIKPAAIVQAGKAAIDRAKSIGAKTDRERAFVEAAGKLFDPVDADQRLRIAAYRDAMAAVAAKFPDDPEASTFYALALAFAASPTDKTYADQLKAGAILEKLWTRQPQHPGLPHYIIHAYDVPALASRAVDAARRYGKIAPDAPHALHMPSHTFTRLGYWKESIDTNVLSAAAARRTNTIGEELHASDYLEYAYLQLGQYDEAKRVVDSLAEIISRIQPGATAGAAPPAAGAFARAAIPARYALERGAWTARAKDPSLVATAEKALDELQSLADRLSAANEPYWTEQVAIQRLGASAWLALAKGQPDRAVTLMREAADREDRTEKSAVTPGPLAPAHEMLGEMLLELNRAKDALSEFDKTIAKEPNRLRARQGADAAKARATRSGVPGRSAARTISVHSVVLDR
jgi:tetratricopeptide (TPR) repeat protein